MTEKAQEGDEFHVQTPDLPRLDGHYVRVEERYTDAAGEEYVALSHDGAGPEVGLPADQLDRQIAGGGVVRRERDPEMHD